MTFTEPTLCTVDLESDPPRLVTFSGLPDLIINDRWLTFIVGVTKPTAANTGVFDEDALSVVNGDLLITEPGVYINLDIKGRVRIQFDEGLAIFYNCRIAPQTDPGTNTAAVINQRRAMLWLIDCDLTTNVYTWTTNGFLGGNVWALRCKISHVVDFFQIYCTDSTDETGPTGAVIEGCYGEDFLYVSPDPTHADDDNATHNDGVQILGGSGTIVRGCNFQMTESPNSVVGPGGQPSGGAYGQAVTITPARAAILGFLVELNWADHGVAGTIVVGAAADIEGTIRLNRYGVNIDPSLKGDNGPIIIHRDVSLEGMPAAPAGTYTDSVNGNVNDPAGTPAAIYRR